MDSDYLNLPNSVASREQNKTVSFFSKEYYLGKVNGYLKSHGNCSGTPAAYWLYTWCDIVINNYMGEYT